MSKKNANALDVIKSEITSEQVQAEIVKNFTPAQAKIFTNNALQLFADNSDLQKCTVDSIRQAVILSAQYGLPLNKEMGLAYVIPYGETAQFMPSYRGLIQIAKRSGLYTKINAIEVYESDLQLDDDELIARLFSVINRQKSSGQMVGVLAGALDINGEVTTEYMTLDDIIHIRNTYAQGHARAGSAWSKDPRAMAKKTVLKRLLKTQVLAHAFEQGVAIDIPTDIDDVTYENSPQSLDDEQAVEKKATTVDVTQDDERFSSMISAIEAGSFTIERARANVIMTDEQKAVLDALEKQMNENEG